MSLIQTIKRKITEHHHGTCGCSHSHDDAAADATTITPDMIVKDVTKRWPQTIAVFGEHKVDFCCGGAHSIAKTAGAHGCADVDALVEDLNKAIAGK